MTNTDELKRLAEAATSGPWSALEPHVGAKKYEYRVAVGRLENHGNSFCSVYMGGPGALHSSKQEIAENAAYIAAANPSAILSLIEEVEQARSGFWGRVAARLQSENERLRAELDKALGVIGPFAKLVDEVAIEREFQPGLVLALRDAAAFTERHKSQGECDE